MATAPPMYDTPVGVGGKIDTTGKVLSGPMAGQTAAISQPTAPYYSSEKGQTLVNNANQNLTRLSQPNVDLKPGQTYTDTQGKTQTAKFDPNTGESFDTKKTGSGLTISEVTDLSGGDLSGYKLNTDGTYSPKPQLTPQQEAVQAAKNDYESFVSQLQSMGFATADTGGISSAWDARIKDMENSNATRLAAITQSGIRSGSQYTGGSGGVWGSIFSGEEIAGIGRIKDLQAQKLAAIASAKQAAEGQNWDRMVKLTDIAQKKYQDQLDALAKLNENTAKQDAKLKAEAGISDELSAGVTDPFKIFQNLQKKGITATTADIADALKNLSISGNPDKVSSEWDQFQYFKKENGLPDFIANIPNEAQQFAAYGQMIKGKAGSGIPGSGPAGMTIGAGAQTGTDEQIIRMRLFAKLSTILNKGSISDSDRVTINDNIASLRSAGLTEQEIMSRLAGFPSDVKTPYNGAFVDLVASNTDTNEQQQVQMTKIGQLLAAGNEEGAMKSVENLAMSQAKKLDSSNYMGSATATAYLQNIDKVRSDLAAGGVTGFVGGSLQNVLGRVKGPKTATLKADITTLVAQFRHDLLGSAVTESEKAFLSDLIPDISSSNFIEQLNAFQGGILTRYNSTRSSVNLPEVTYSQALKPQERLGLYGDSVPQDFWGSNSSSGPTGITSGDGSYNIPD